ncbi:TPA: DUF551 domain-containing protein [Klebsiella variicola subsp. variicola]|nr:DUF551 domain-containing protein [Klebsiella variicola subsp. variicola]HCM6631664.1 DUF551 domain-containing protein [Klebsiella variicola subsp. variicola]
MELSRMALSAMDSEPVEMPLDYLQGHKDGLEWAARLAEANHPETGDWLYDDPIELAKAIRKGPDMPPAQPVADREPDRNPVLAYADSYRDMAKQGVESVPIWSVITDLERNIAPLYRHAQPALVVLDEVTAEDCPAFVNYDVTEVDEAWARGFNSCRAAMLAAAPQLPGSELATVPGKWIPVSEQMPEDRTQVILWDAEIGEVTSGHYSHKTHTFYHCGDAIENEITHWMPTPAAPQEVK